MLTVNPVILAVKLPVPEPLVIFELDIVGFGVVAQQIPRTDTVEQPSLMTLPPQVAELYETFEGEKLDTLGKTKIVVNDSWFP